LQESGYKGDGEMKKFPVKALDGRFFFVGKMAESGSSYGGFLELKRFRRC